MTEQAEYQYDVFISYSHTDHAWVWDELLPHLEGAGLRVCIDDRDFEIGLARLINIERAVDNSPHTLIVLTPSWVDSEWTEFEGLLAGAADPAGRRRKLIPLILKPCELPSRIAMLTCADFTCTSNYENQFSRLLRQLQSGSIIAGLHTRETAPSAASPPAIAYLHPVHQVPSAEDHFVGRESVIEALVTAVKTTRMTIILGIPGIGKTALMRQIASRFDQKCVFWYEFWPGLVSLDDVLVRLARFLDSRPGYGGNLVGAVRASTFSERDRIELLVKELNTGCYYLFFDSAHHIEGHSALESFFCALKEQLRQGAVFLAGRSRPAFCASVDAARQLIKSVLLEGLSVSETNELFAQNGITLSLETAEALANRFGGLPLALELVVGLLGEDVAEEEMLALADEVEEQAIDYLFDEVYKRLDPPERALLTTASLFNLPFRQTELLSAHRAIFGPEEGTVHFAELRRRLIIQRFAPDFYWVHEVIRALGLKYADELNWHRVKLADYLVHQIPDDARVYLEAILLYYEAEAFDQAAELAVPIVDTSLVSYDPALAATILSGFQEAMVSPEQWVWLVGSRGVLAHFWRRYDEAEDHYRTMLQLAGKTQNKAATAIALQRLGNMYLGRDDRMAEKYYLDSLALKKELDDLEGQAQLYSNLGALYTGQGRLAEAHSALEKGLTLLEKAEAPEWEKLTLYANLGFLHAEQERWGEANNFVERARRVAKEMGSPYDMAKLTHNLGVHEGQQGNQKAARERYLEALEIAEVYGFWEIEEMSSVALGKLYYEAGHQDEAIACFERVAEIQERIEDRAKLGATYFDIGTFYWHKGDHQRALDCYEKGFSLFEYLTDEEQVRLYLINVYRLAAQSGKPRRIANVLKRLKNRLLAQPLSYALAKVYGTMGAIYLRLLDRSRVGLACMRQEVNLLAQIDLRREQVEASTDLGLAYEELEHYGCALDTYTETIQLAELHSLLHHTSVAYYNRGNCFATLEMWQQAEDDYRQALEITGQTKDVRLQQAVYHNLGETYRRSGRREEAVALLRSSLEFSRQHGDIEDEIRTLNNLGLAYQALSQSQEALDCFKKALELSCQHYRRREESNVLISLGNFYLESGEPDRAKGYYEQALAAARATENADLEEGSVLSLAYAHRQLGTFDEIAEDFRAVAERAGALKHYDNLVQLLDLAGEINLEEGEPEAAAEMFEQALIVALGIGFDRFQEFESRAERPLLFPKLAGVLARICVSIDGALRRGAIDHTQAFYNSLLGKLQEADRWGETGPLMVDYMKPIGDYLTERPDQPIGEFVAAAWGDESTEGANGSQDQGRGNKCVQWTTPMRS